MLRLAFLSESAFALVSAAVAFFDAAAAFCSSAFCIFDSTICLAVASMISVFDSAITASFLRFLVSGESDESDELEEPEELIFLPLFFLRCLIPSLISAIFDGLT